MSTRKLTVIYSVSNKVELEQEIMLCDKLIADLKLELNTYTGLNALGASREYRTPDIHRRHLDEFVSKSRLLKLLKMRKDILKALSEDTEAISLSINPL